MNKKEMISDYKKKICNKCKNTKCKEEINIYKEEQLTYVKCKNYVPNL